MPNIGQQWPLSWLKLAHWGKQQKHAIHASHFLRLWLVTPQEAKTQLASRNTKINWQHSQLTKCWANLCPNCHFSETIVMLCKELLSNIAELKHCIKKKVPLNVVFTPSNPALTKKGCSQNIFLPVNSHTQIVVSFHSILRTLWHGTMIKST